MGHCGGRVGLELRRGVRADRRRELHDRRGENEEDSGVGGRANPRRVHRQGGRKDGAIVG